MQIQPRFIYPPRPMKNPVPAAELERYERYGWRFMCKYNDLRAVFVVTDSGIKVYERRGECHSFRLTPKLEAELLEIVDRLGLRKDGWCCLDGGILTGKNKNMPELIVLWDVLVANGEWLVDTTYDSRYQMLVGGTTGPAMVTINTTAFDLGLKLTDHVLVPKTYDRFADVWKLVNAVNAAAGWTTEKGGEPVLEGTVAKQFSAKLEPAWGEKNNESWQARSRVRTGRSRY